MTKEKQIEEKRDISDIIYWSGYGFDRGTCNDISKQIQEQGYRKASDVAREIFEEIENLLTPTISALFMTSETLVDVSKSHISEEKAIDNIRKYLGKAICSKYQLKKALAELKKKYTEGER